MPAISMQDLENAKTDVDHIAEVATSLAPTATDRLGHVKQTLAGAVGSITAITDRGVWTAGTAYLIKDIVIVGGIVYVCVSGHTAGATFAGDSAKWRVHQGATVEDLANDTDPAKGAGMVGSAGITASAGFDSYDVGVVQEKLQALANNTAARVPSVADYDALRVIPSGIRTVYVSGYLVTASPSGVAGTFVLDPADAASVDNGGTIIVTTDGRRFKRQYSGAVDIRWFKANQASANNTAAIQAALDAAYNVFIPEGNWQCGGLALRTGHNVYGAGFKSQLWGISGQTAPTFSIIGVVGTQKEEVVIRDLCVYNYNSQSTAVFIKKAYQVRLINMQIVGARCGVDAESFEGLDITMSRITGCTELGVATHRDSDADLNSWVTITDSTINGNLLGGALFKDTASVVLNNVKLLTNHDYGAKFLIDSAKVSTKRGGYFVANHCDVDSNYNASLHIENATTVELTGNWISGGRTSSQSSLNPAGAGVYFVDSVYTTSTANHVFGCGGQGFRIIGGSNHSILGGSVIGNGDSAGIYAEATRVSISNVQIVPSGGSGFTQAAPYDLATGDYHKVTYNQVTPHAVAGNVSGADSVKIGNS